MTDRHSPHAERKFAAKEIIAAWLGAFFGIAALAWVVTNMPEAKLLVIGSFGASAVLIYGSPKAPFAQPKKLNWWSCPLSISRHVDLVLLAGRINFARSVCCCDSDSLNAANSNNAPARWCNGANCGHWRNRNSLNGLWVHLDCIYRRHYFVGCRFVNEQCVFARQLSDAMELSCD